MASTIFIVVSYFAFIKTKSLLIKALCHLVHTFISISVRAEFLSKFINFFEQGKQNKQKGKKHFYDAWCIISYSYNCFVDDALLLVRDFTQSLETNMLVMYSRFQIRYGIFMKIKYANINNIRIINK